MADINRDLVRMCERLKAAIEAAIALLDWMDAPAEDREPDACWEPWLATPEGHERQLPWCRRGNDDREQSSFVLKEHALGGAPAGRSRA